MTVQIERQAAKKIDSKFKIDMEMQCYINRTARQKNMKWFEGRRQREAHFSKERQSQMKIC